MHVLWQVIVKEFLQLRRDRRMIPVIFVAPIVQLVVFGFAVNTDVTDVPMVLVDQDRSAASRELVEPLRGAPATSSSSAARSAPTRSTAGSCTSRAQMGLVIPPGFGAAIASGRTTALQIIADGSDAASANVALGYAGAARARLRRAWRPSAGWPASAAAAAPGRSSSSRASSTTPT